MSHKRERLSRAGEQRPNERTKTTKAAKREGRTDTVIHFGRRAAPPLEECGSAWSWLPARSRHGEKCLELGLAQFNPL